MGIVQQLLDFFRQLLTWWLIVEPWEQAIRVRFGKHVRLFGAGVYLRIPFFDIVYKQNVRRRVSSIPVQTLTTRDGKTITLHGSIGYKIVDVLKLQQTLHDAENSVQQEVLGIITRYVVNHAATDCTPEKVVAAVSASLDLSKYGLGDVDFFLAGYVSDIPTYRLIQDSLQTYYPSSTYLNTQTPLTPAVAPR